MGSSNAVGHYDRRYMDQLLDWRKIIVSDVVTPLALQALTADKVINGCDTRYAYDNAMHIFVKLPANVTSCSLVLFSNNRCRADFNSGLRETVLTIEDTTAWYKLKTYESVAESSVITIQDFPVGGIHIAVTDIVLASGTLSDTNAIVLDYQVAR